ncbi:MAG TPA: fibronectin type III domain-containing protein [Clostridiaceae bacterium]|nr:fibronectin type III domain-containing protein [Clostridiaceae bacterium]
MKNLTTYCCHLVALALLLALFSCKQETSDIGGFTDKTPENVHMSEYSSSSITVSWNGVEGATSYTAQLLGAKDSDSPIDAYTTTSKDFHRFSGLEETRGYYVRVRANVNYDTGNWVYIMNGEEKARIMPKYGFVDEDFEEPEPEPAKELYPDFPEGFENPIGARKGSHTGAGPTGRQSEIYPTGEWLMPNMYTNSSAAIVHKIDTWAVMMNANVATYLEMDFDLPYGASKLSFYYGTATKTNANDITVTTGPIAVKVEYSQDSGVTWTQLGDDLMVTTVEEQYFQEYELDIEGPVRFRIGKNDSRARLMVDEIAIYEN